MTLIIIVALATVAVVGSLDTMQAPASMTHNTAVADSEGTHFTLELNEDVNVASSP